MYTYVHYSYIDVTITCLIVMLFYTHELCDHLGLRKMYDFFIILFVIYFILIS